MILSAEKPQESARKRWVMAQSFGISKEAVARICPLFPKERGGKRVDDRKVLSGIIPVIQKGLAGWMPRPPMAATKPSTTVAAAGETRVCLS